MAITLVREQDLGELRGYYQSADEGVVAWRTFYVETNDPSHTEAQISVASFGGVTIPLGLDFFPGSSIAQCYKIQPRRVKGSTLKWLVRCDYKSVFNQFELERSQNPNPLDRATAITGQSRTIMVPKRRLLRTPAYQEWSEAGPGSLWTLREARNSASDPLDPPIDVAMTEWELHCEKNKDTFPSWFLSDSYANGVNSADQVVTIRGTSVTIKKGTGKLSNFTFSEERKENGTAYIRIGWNVTIRWYRPVFGSETDRFGPWDEERLDEGRRTYDNSIGRWVNLPGNIDPAVPFNGAGGAINVTGAAIAESDLWWYAYRPFGDRVNYAVLPWS